MYTRTPKLEIDTAATDLSSLKPCTPPFAYDIIPRAGNVMQSRITYLRIRTYGLKVAAGVTFNALGLLVSSLSRTGRRSPVVFFFFLLASADVLRLSFFRRKKKFLDSSVIYIYTSIYIYATIYRIITDCARAVTRL